MVLKVTRFDPAEHLETEDNHRLFSRAAMESNDARAPVANALGVVPAREMTEIAAEGAGLGRRALVHRRCRKTAIRRAETLLAVLGVLGLELTRAEERPAAEPR